MRKAIETRKAIVTQKAISGKVSILKVACISNCYKRIPYTVSGSVADPTFFHHGSRIPDPRSELSPSRIPDSHQRI
jgi:hypothetical protein